MADGKSYFATHPTLRRAFIAACALLAVYAVVQMFGQDRAWSLVEAVARFLGFDLGGPAITPEVITQ